MTLLSTKWEELDFELFAEFFGISGQLLFRMTLQNGWHGHAWVWACERKDASTCYAIGIRVELGARGHLIAKI
jgi:hypothetical protein